MADFELPICHSRKRHMPVASLLPGRYDDKTDNFIPGSRQGCSKSGLSASSCQPMMSLLRPL